MFIPRQTLWTQQPQQAVGIDWSNPITKGLVVALLPDANGSIATPNGRAGVIQRGLSVAEANSCLDGTMVSGLFYTGNPERWSVSLYLGRWLASNNMDEVALVATNTSGSRVGNIRKNVTSVLGTSIAIPAYSKVIPTAFRWYSWGVADFFENGTKYAVTDNVSGNFVSGVTRTLIAGVAGSCYATHVYVWSRQLSDAEISSISQNPWQIFKRPSQEIFIPLAATGGTTSVSSDLSASYTVTGSVSADATAAYSIRSAVSADASASYAIRASAQADQSAAYSIRAAVSADLASSYAIQTASTVTSGLDAAYAVRGSVAGDISVGYQIAAAVQAEIAAAYAVRAAVQNDLAAGYSVPDSVTNVVSDIVCTYAINGVYPSYPSAESIAAAVWQRAIEDGMSGEQMLRIMFSALAGVTSGVGSNTERYMALDGVTPRIEATFDANNNRTSITLDGA